MTATLINITRTSINDICEWEHITDDKVEYCEENKSDYEWVDDLTGYIYTFETWDIQLLDWCQYGPVQEVFYGYLTTIIHDMKDEDSIITLWDINVVDIYDWEGITDCELAVKYLGKVDLEKLATSMKENK